MAINFNRPIDFTDPEQARTFWRDCIEIACKVLGVPKDVFSGRSADEPVIVEEGGKR